MYAVFKDHGRQYRASEGDVLELDLDNSVSVGDTVTFSEVLCCGGDSGVKVGTPLVDGASVTAEVIAKSRGPKLVVQKLRRRKNSRRKTGHRQWHNRVRVTKITA